MDNILTPEVESKIDAMLLEVAVLAKVGVVGKTHNNTNAIQSHQARAWTSSGSVD